MKIIFYCQHVLGIGHLFRSLEICKALKHHEVLLISGGPHIETNIPKHIRVIRLPELQMDTGFKGLFSPHPNIPLEHIKAQRQKNLLALFEKEKPDLFLVELYPFGRKAFRFEIDPLLAEVHNQKPLPCGIVCSVRDILVEKEDQQKHEGRAVDTLNRYFDAVLVHSDPNLIKIEETFFRLGEIRIPLFYTGYIAKMPPVNARQQIRSRLEIMDKDLMIVASAGGGSVGKPLLESAMRAFQTLSVDSSARLFVYTGPYIDAQDFSHLQTLANPKVKIEKFTSDFLAYLAAADLSISMGGYNTSMNLLACGVPALVWPFGLNREQRLRAQRLAERGALKILNEEDLQPDRLARIMVQTLSEEHPGKLDIDLNGAANTVRWLEDWFAERNMHQ
ncbi:MAG: glycosyl transferase [Deltaproteobacteria bacterium]|jgi:predicted glycosyltransferase|nr:glycosyl transferase [Deltaproteobacteria bacterium]